MARLKLGADGQEIIPARLTIASQILCARVMRGSANLADGTIMKDCLYLADELIEAHYETLALKKDRQNG